MTTSASVGSRTGSAIRVGGDCGTRRPAPPDGDEDEAPTRAGPGKIEVGARPNRASGCAERIAPALIAQLRLLHLCAFVCASVYFGRRRRLALSSLFAFAGASTTSSGLSMTPPTRHSGGSPTHAFVHALSQLDNVNTDGTKHKPNPTASHNETPSQTHSLAVTLRKHHLACLSNSRPSQESSF